MFGEGIKEYFLSLWRFKYCCKSLKDGMYRRRLLRKGGSTQNEESWLCSEI